MEAGYVLKSDSAGRGARLLLLMDMEDDGEERMIKVVRIV